MLKHLKMTITLSIATLAMLFSTSFTQNQGIMLQPLDGEGINLKDLRGKVVVMSFGGTWVPMASRELPALQKLSDRFSDRGVQVYWVSINSARPGARTYASDDNLREFAQKNNLRVKMLRDPDQEAYRYFGLDALPTLLILDRDGKVARKHVGFGTDQGEAYNQIIRELDQLLK
jgi:peroxiredoxin